MEKKEREELKKRYLKFAEDDRCIAFIPDGDGDENNLYLGDIFEDVEEELLDFISEEVDKARERELEWILKNCSGGGNWRRIVNQRLSKLKTKE